MELRTQTSFARACALLLILPALVASCRKRRVPPSRSCATMPASVVPRDLPGKVNLAVALLEEKKYPRAVEVFRQVARARPEDAASRANLGLALQRAGSWGEALKATRRAVKLGRRDPRVLVLAAHVLSALGRTDEGIRILEKAVAGLGAVVHLRHTLVERYRYRRKPREALTHHDPQVRHHPRNLGLLHGLARAQAEAVELPAALGTARTLMGLLRQAGRATPPLVTRHRDLEAAVKAGKGKEALKALRVMGFLLDPDPLFRRDRALYVKDTMPSPITTAGHPGRLPAPARFTSSPHSLGPLQDACLVRLGGKVALLSIARGSGRLRRHRFVRGRGFVPVPSRAARAVTGGLACAAGDLDNDGHQDLVVLTRAGLWALAGTAAGALAARPPGGRGNALVLSRKLPAAQARVALADHDLDGDLDVVAQAGRTLMVIRNNRDGTFTDQSHSLPGAPGSAAPAAAPVPVPAIPSIHHLDLDNDSTADLMVLSSQGRPRLFLNRGRGELWSAGRGARSVKLIRAMHLMDLNEDLALDLITCPRGEGEGCTYRLNDGVGHFSTDRKVALPAGVRRLGHADLDSDGLPEILALTRSGLAVLRRDRGGWRAGPVLSPGQKADRKADLEDFVVGDMDSSGSLDLLLLDRRAPPTLLLNRGGGAWARVSLWAKKSNRDGVGARMVVDVGVRHRRLDITAGGHPGEHGPVRLVGLGRRRRADRIKVLWPNDTWTARCCVRPRATVQIVQSALLIASCPFLYAHDGQRLRFVTDLLGSAALGLPLTARSVYPIRPWEYVRIPPGALGGRGGRYRLLITDELRELVYLDRLQLVEVEHPRGTEVYGNDRYVMPPYFDFKLFLVRSPEPPRKALDHQGRDVTARLRRLDHRYPDGFAVVDEMARPHGVTLDFGTWDGPAGGRLVLILSGGLWWGELLNYRISQTRDLHLKLPQLEVASPGGGWRVAIKDLGIPAGRGKTFAVDITDHVRPGTVRLRIRTNMRLYWDRILLARDAAVLEPGRPGGGLRTRLLDPSAARLFFFGHARPLPGDGLVPEGRDPQQVTPVSRYRPFSGMFTRYGDVRELLRRADDRFVIFHPGDGLELEFPRGGAGARTQRTSFLFLRGYDKDGDRNTAHPTTVTPLPFGAMPGYPYPGRLSYPYDDEHLEYLDRYNTRRVER